MSGYGYIEGMDESLAKVITYIFVPMGAILFWKYVVKPCAGWCVDRIPSGPIKDSLTKDRGGHY